MLVLTRRENQSVMLGDDIEVTVLEIREGKVRLGFSAPSDVPVHREEVYRAIQLERQDKQS